MFWGHGLFFGLLGWWLLSRGIMTLVMLGLLVWGILAITRNRGVYSPGSARSILEERYAKGEIQRDEYLQKKQDLGGAS
jgi:putative membrane protein